MPKQKKLQRRLSSLQAKTQKVQGKVGQTALSTGPSAPGLASLAVSDTQSPMTVPTGQSGDMQLPSTEPDFTGQAGDMQLPTTGLSDAGSTPLTTEDLIGQFQTQADEANRMNEERYTQGLGIHEQIVGMFGPESQFGAGYMDQYQRERDRQLATQEQNMISRGLYNTSSATGMASDYEQRVGVPFRMQLADMQMTKQAEALQGQAGFIERREDTPPDPALMANLVSQAEARPDEVDTTGTGGTGGEGGDATGAASYFTGGGSAPSYAGGGISGSQYRMEAKRQRVIEQKSKQIGTLNNRLRTKQKQLTKLPAGDPKRDKVEDQVAQLEGKLAEAQDILDENADPIVDSGVFASEQTRRREAAKKAEDEKGRMGISLGLQYGESYADFKSRQRAFG